MSKPYDATLKDLAGLDPAGLLTPLDAPPTERVRLLNVDLSTVTAATDIVFGLGEPLREIVHVETQSGPDQNKHRDLLVYHALLHRQYQVPVHSILLLLRPQAQLRSQTGQLTYAARPGRGKMDFGYEVLRLWERPVEELLQSGLGALPLAPLCRLPEGMSVEEGMRWVFGRVLDRLQTAATPGLVQRLLRAAFTLSELRLDRTRSLAILQEVVAMEKPLYDVYMDELFEKRKDELAARYAARTADKARAQTLQETILRQGRKRFGEPDAATQQALTAIAERERLEQLSERLLDVASWQELLQDSPAA